MLDWAGLAGTYSDAAGAAFCHACPALSYTHATGSDNSTACVCNAGYTGPDGGGDCTACAEGKYKDALGSAECKTGCSAGYMGADGGGDCTACPYGKYKDALGSAECTNCPAGEQQGGAARAR